MAVGLAQVAVQEFFVNGVPAVGGLLFFYAAGTTTKITTYTDSTGATPQSNPVVLNSRGEPQGSGGQSLGLWLPANTNYKMVYSPVGDTDPPTHAIYTVDNINSSGGGGGGGTAAGSAAYPTIAAAEAAATPSGTTFVTIAGYYAAGDLGGGTYIPASAGAGAGKYQDANSNWWILQAAPFVTPDQFGAKVRNLSFDSNFAIANALSFAAGAAVLLNSGGYRSSAGIVVPSSTALFGLDFQPAVAGNVGTFIQFDLAVANCVSVLDGTTNNTASVRGFSITRAAGTIPSGCIGLRVNGGWNIQCKDICVSRQAIGYQIIAPSPVGISCYCEGLFTAGAITDVHLEQNAWPELSLIGCRFGVDGTGDVACNAYLRLNHGTGGADGPNTLKVTNCQFNAGDTTPPKYFIQLVNQPGSNAVDFTFVNSYFENVSTAGIFSDSSVASLFRLKMAGCGFNVVNAAGGGLLPMMALNAATQIVEWNVVGCEFFCSDFTLAPTANIIGLSIAGCLSAGTLVLAIPAASNVNCVGNTWAGATITGPGNGNFVGESYTAAPPTFAGGPKAASFVGCRQGWTPVLTFGGASVGITYAAQLGSYQNVGGFIIASYLITLTSKGSSTGAVLVTGLPGPPDTILGVTGNGDISYYENMSGLTGALSANINAATSNFAISQSGSTGMVQLASTNFTNTSVLYGTIVYPV